MKIPPIEMLEMAAGSPDLAKTLAWAFDQLGQPLIADSMRRMEQLGLSKINPPAEILPIKPE